MTGDRARAFADALRDLESSGDVSRFVAGVFADDVELVRPETGQQERGAGGARQFWQQYVDQFEEIRSEFSRLVDGEVAVLEWTSSGRLSGGADVSYSGVSLLDFDGDGRVVRFATYYDTAPFGVAAVTGRS
jgi:ketosteroid isomerase-like protein